MKPQQTEKMVLIRQALRAFIGLGAQPRIFRRRFSWMVLGTEFLAGISVAGSFQKDLAFREGCADKTTLSSFRL